MNNQPTNPIASMTDDEKHALAKRITAATKGEVEVEYSPTCFQTNAFNFTDEGSRGNQFHIKLADPHEKFFTGETWADGRDNDGDLMASILETLDEVASEIRSAVDRAREAYGKATPAYPWSKGGAA